MAFAAVLLAGGPVACGGVAKSGSAVADLPKVTSAAAVAPSGKNAEEVTPAAPVAPSGKNAEKVTPAAAVATAGKNAEDITSLRYRISGTVPGKGRLEAEASMNTQPLAMSMKMTAATVQGGNAPFEIRFVDKVMYVGGSAIRPESLNGKSRLSAAPAVWGRGGVDNQSYGVLPSQLQANPTAQSTLLTGSKDLRLIGTETVDGARTTHYKGTVNRKGLIGGRLDQFFQLEVSDPLTMDLWIGGDHRTKQFRLRAEHNDDLVGTGDGPLDLTVTFLDINQPVTIESPPAKDTTPLAPTDAQEG